MAPATRKSLKKGNDPDTPISLEFPDGLPIHTTNRRKRIPCPQTASPVNSSAENITAPEPPIPTPLTPTPTIPNCSRLAEVPPPTTPMPMPTAPKEPSPPAEPFITPFPHPASPANPSAEMITTDTEPPTTTSTLMTTPTTATVPKELPPPTDHLPKGLPPPADHSPIRVSATPWYRSTTIFIPLLGIVAVVGWVFAAIVYTHEQCVTVPRLAGSSKGRAAMKSCWR
ncbi:MAG: hypothetical protein LQ343_007734 [Gyalolechia ehrenbergii]|nr:MAG: hypothetical protein LQ343_007734 [Gyalolechia ehrenbergii]